MTDFLIQHYLADTAETAPEKTAVIDKHRKLSYGELDAYSAQLSFTLNRCGVTQRELVGVFLEKSLEAIVSFFGILKTGNCYVPLDAVYSPLERILKIIEVGELKYIITDAVLWHRLTAFCAERGRGMPTNCMVLSISLKKNFEMSVLASRHQKEPEAVDSRECEEKIKPLDYGIIDQDTAYILYTSGSTGVPKGVMISHANARTFINWAVSYFKPEPGAVFASHAPLHFDLSVFDIYVAIATGGCVQLVPSDITSNPRALVKWMGEKEINYWYSVPSVWVAILNYAKIDGESLRPLKKILFAGEVFPPAYLKQLMNKLPDAEYFNLYGPTETNVCTYYHVKSSDTVGIKPVPIGQACANTEVIAVNDAFEPLSADEEGELYVRGSGVTKGYYKDPEKTAEVFVKSPFRRHNGEMLYKTGDIVRKNASGDYDYIGRKDFMVKIAGFRVELEEIEHVMYQNSQIEEAVVVPYFKEDRGNNTLGALIKLRERKSLSLLDLKKFISEKLPHYMIPELICFTEEVPKNANGKLDRQVAQELFSKKMRT